MNDIIKPHSFEEAKEHIQSFSSRTSSDFQLDKVSHSGGLFGWFDHTVTGDELNRLTGEIQDYLIKFNEFNSDFIREFGQVYKALESLDGEYIPAILTAVKGAEEASKQAKAANQDIKQMIEAQNRIIAVLNEHKKSLDQLKHLNRIDELWNDMQHVQNELTTCKTNVGKSDKANQEIQYSIKKIEDDKQSEHQVVKALKMKVKTAYIFAASALGLAVVELILSIAGIL